MNSSLLLRSLYYCLASSCTFVTVVHSAARSSVALPPATLSESFLADYKKSLLKERDYLMLSLSSLNNLPMLLETKVPTFGAIADQASKKIAALSNSLAIVESGQEFLASNDAKSPDASLLSPSDKRIFQAATHLYLTRATAAMSLRQAKKDLINAIKQDIDRWVQEHKETLTLEGAPLLELIENKKNEAITAFNNKLSTLQILSNTAPCNDTAQELCPITGDELFAANLEIALYLSSTALKVIDQRASNDEEKMLDMDDPYASEGMLSE